MFCLAPLGDDKLPPLTGQTIYGPVFGHNVESFYHCVRGNFNDRTCFEGNYDYNVTDRSDIFCTTPNVTVSNTVEIEIVSQIERIPLKQM